MNCPSCGSAVREGAKFCGKCGTALPHGCPACGHLNSSEDRYCLECGTVLFELRAVTHLAQSFLADGEGARAREILEPVLGAFTQNRTGPDYIRAIQLLG